MDRVREVLVTGAAGFVGRNLAQALRERDDIHVLAYDADGTPEQLSAALAAADVIVHLAGVNRPKDPHEFETGNTGLTRQLCDELREMGRTPKIIMSSSIQALEDNPYGASKRAAEIELEQSSNETGADVTVFRFKNVFGKWSRPEYNSVVATFCYNAAHGIPLRVDDPEKRFELVYIDDVVDRIIGEIDAPPREPHFRFADEMPGFAVTLGALADTVESFPRTRPAGMLPDFADRFTTCLYSTYLSYLDAGDIAYGLDRKSDERGSLAEFVKSAHAGQIFVSRTKPGITRGNHHHRTKVEKFLVVEGRGVIRLRHLATDDLVELEISGDEYRVVDIPPGYTHSIENVGEGDLVTLFWANQVFDREDPDTYFCEVRHQ